MAGWRILGAVKDYTLAKNPLYPFAVKGRRDRSPLRSNAGLNEEICTRPPCAGAGISEDFRPIDRVLVRLYYINDMIPVSAGREGTFLLVFLAQYLAGVCYLGLQFWSADLRLLDSGEFVAALVVAATANSILLVEGIPMVAERFLKRQKNEGIKEGRNSQQKKWEEWNRRRLQAERKQQPFTEEPPVLDKNDD